MEFNSSGWNWWDHFTHSNFHSAITQKVCVWWNWSDLISVYKQNRPHWKKIRAVDIYMLTSFSAINLRWRKNGWKFFCCLDHPIVRSIVNESFELKSLNIAHKSSKEEMPPEVDLSQLNVVKCLVKQLHKFLTFLRFQF